MSSWGGTDGAEGNLGIGGAEGMETAGIMPGAGPGPGAGGSFGSAWTSSWAAGTPAARRARIARARSVGALIVPDLGARRP
jgi:hypothetical protein